MPCAFTSVCFHYCCAVTQRICGVHLRTEEAIPSLNHWWSGGRDYISLFRFATWMRYHVLLKCASSTLQSLKSESRILQMPSARLSLHSSLSKWLALFSARGEDIGDSFGEGRPTKEWQAVGGGFDASGIDIHHFNNHNNFDLSDTKIIDSHLASVSIQGTQGNIIDGTCFKWILPYGHNLTKQE